MKRKKQKDALALGKEFERLFPTKKGYEVSIELLRSLEKGELLEIVVYHDLTMGSWKFIFWDGVHTDTEMFPRGFPFATPKGAAKNLYSLEMRKRDQAIVITPNRHSSFLHTRNKWQQYFFDGLFDGHLPARRHKLSEVCKAIHAYCEKFMITELFTNYLVKQKRTGAGFRELGYTEKGEYFFGDSVPGCRFFKPGRARRRKFRRPRPKPVERQAAQSLGVFDGLHTIHP